MNWDSFANGVILLILVAGHTELWVTLVNRVHSLRIECRRLRHLRHVHDALVVSFPLVLLWFVGFRGPGLLRGGSWSALPSGWTVYLGFCAVGAVGLICSSIRSRLKKTPELQLSNHTSTVDIIARLGYRPVGQGPFRFLTYVPGNEIFQIEVATKVFRSPRLPSEWDGLSILHLSDLHFMGTLERPFFEQVIRVSTEMQADLIVFTGDLLDDQRLTEWLPATLGQLRAPLGCFFVLGNHDSFFDPQEIRLRLSELGWQDVAGKTIGIEQDGRSLVVGGTERPWMGTHPDFSTAPADAFRLLLSHTPDHFEWARQQSVDLMLAGHNHGGQVVLPIIGPVYSPSRFGVQYASGAFWQEPTLMYVSRGISGRHPLRWNCRPELTKLVLRAAER